MMKDTVPTSLRQKQSASRQDERGAALITVLIILFLLAAISISVLAVVTNEARVAGSDLQRTETFYAASSGMEQMTHDFTALFQKTINPSAVALTNIANSPPAALTGQGFQFNQTLAQDAARLAAMRATQGLVDGTYPSVTVSSGPFAGMFASVSPYILTSTATQTITGTKVTLQRSINNYLIPLFQFGMFSNEDIELHPGPAFTFNGRLHANGNIYLNGNVTLLNKATTANELVTDVLRNGSARTGTLSMQVGSINVPITMGSVNQGPNFSSIPGTPGYFPTAPSGTVNTSWVSTSVAAAQSGVPNQFGGQLLTRSTGGVPLLLPLQLDGNPTRELIKRRMPNDSQTLKDSRYNTKAEIRIFLDDEVHSPDASSIGSNGVLLSSFVPESLPEGVLLAGGGGRALWRVKDDSTYADTVLTAVKQTSALGLQADTVRGVKPRPSASPSPAPTPDRSSNNVTIPWGAGLSGRIFIQIVDPSGVAHDVTTQILSMGVTEGEPNGIVYLQRPLWASFTQGSRDASGGTNSLTYITNGSGIAPNINGTNIGISGRIKSSALTQDGTYGYAKSLLEDTSPALGVRTDSPGPAGDWNSIVPINVYNVREGWLSASQDNTQVYERGMTNVVELNMRNLARWMDGVYDTNLLAGTAATSTNINGAAGYIVYVSDRRGDKVKTFVDPSGATINATNGIVDNEDIYGPNNLLDPGEDMLGTGLFVKDTTELPDPSGGSTGFPMALGGGATARTDRAKTLAAWTNPSNYFRRAVRLFNGENLQVTGANDKLSNIKGITVCSENLAYVWGNYNTTGINGQPAGASTLNDSTQTFFYLGNQVPTAIVTDALFPLSKTWFDGSSAMYPEDSTKRPADNNLGSIGTETSVRAGVIAGNNISALAGTPDHGTSGNESRLNGGMHNFPRFLENWNSQRWNFVGSLIPLYHSTQAVGQYYSDNTIYSPPTRNWAFDITFTNPSKLPPGTPSFEYIQPTAFKEVF